MAARRSTIESPAARGARLALASLLALALLVPAAGAQVPAAQATFSGYATGTILHTNELQQGSTRLANADVSFSGASVASKGLATQILNEMSRPVSPALADKNTFGRGSGLELGINQPVSGAANVLVLPGPNNQALTASAPASTQLLRAEVLSPKLAPLAYASVLRAEAQARWQAGNDCVLGADLSRGLGYAADAQLVDTGTSSAVEALEKPVLATSAPSPDRAVSQSFSHTLFVRQVDRSGNVLGNNFGLMSENRQTIAPVTILKGTPNQTTIEFLGEWVLQAVAGGVGASSAFVHYGPGKVSPQSAVLRTINAAGDVTNIITFQQLMQAINMPDGLQIVVPNVAEITLAEKPRAIGGAFKSAPTEGGDGTVASAAIDVARVKILEQKDAAGNVTVRAAEVRVGHMETRAQVPVGGISCSVPVTKIASPTSVTVGNPFTTTITINNPFDCDLAAVKVTDTITTEKAARFKITATSPTANSLPAGENLATGTVVWNDIGTIPSGQSKQVSVTFVAQGGTGNIIDVADATGTLTNCKGTGTSVAGVASAVAGAGLTGKSAPLKVPVGGVLGEQLPRTGPGTPATVFAGLALMGLAGLGWAYSRRRLI